MTRRQLRVAIVGVLAVPVILGISVFIRDHAIARRTPIPVRTPAPARPRLAALPIVDELVISCDHGQHPVDPYIVHETGTAVWLCEGPPWTLRFFDPSQIR